MSLVRKFILTVSAVGFTASSGFANQLLKAESSNATVRSVSTITVAACSITGVDPI